jgi:hypothetical protein
MTADERIFSPAKRYCSEMCHIISAVLWLYYLQTSLFISIYQTKMKLQPPVEFAKEASLFHYTFWEKHDLIAASNYLYLFMWATSRILFVFLFFKPFIWNRAEVYMNPVK